MSAPPTRPPAWPELFLFFESRGGERERKHRVSFFLNSLRGGENSRGTNRGGKKRLTPVVHVGDDKPHPDVEGQAPAQLVQHLVARLPEVVPMPPEEDSERAADAKDRARGAHGRRRRHRERRERACDARRDVHRREPRAPREPFRQRAQTVQGEVVGGEVEQVSVEQDRSEETPPLARTDCRVDFGSHHGQPLPRE